MLQQDERVEAIHEDYELGLMSDEERHKKIVDIWNEANEEVGDAMAENCEQAQPDLHDGLLWSAW